MNLITSNLMRAAAVAIALPLLGVCAAVQINSTCYGPGSCISPANTTDSITNGNPISGSINQSFSVGSDSYSLSATYSASYNGSSEYVVFDPTVTYTGTGPTSSKDTITVDFFQDIFDPTPGPFSASTQTEHVPLSVPAGVTASGQLFFDGLALPKVGPYGPGDYDVTDSRSFGEINSDFLGYEYQFTFDFAKGDLSGTSVSSAPEPADTIPAALGLTGIVLGAWRRRKK